MFYRTCCARRLASSTRTSTTKSRRSSIRTELLHGSARIWTPCVVGNFAAHPIKSTDTGQVVEVEPGEAGWLLDVLERAFDFYFVQPDKARRQREALNEKLTEAGKPELKT